MKQKANCFTYNDRYGRHSIPVKDIVRIQSNGNFVTIFLSNRHSVTIIKKLKTVRKILSRNDSFCWIHRSHIVNIAYAETICKGRPSRLLMKIGNPVPVRKPCVRKLREIINSL